MQVNLLLFFLSLLILSCNQKTIYNDWKTIKNNQWYKDSILTFKYVHKEVPTKGNLYNIEIALSNTKAYEFNNLFLKAEIIDPNGTIIALDTLEYQMTDKSGQFIGTGIASIKENMLLYKEDLTFKYSGLYTFTISHLMRRLGEANGIEKLRGINAVGITIKHVE